MDDLMNFLKEIPNDQARALITFIVMLPVGWALTFIKHANVRLIYSLVFGVFFQYYIYGFTMLHVLLATCVNLAIVKLCNPMKIGKYAFIYNFIHNSLIHLYRLIFENDSWGVEISVIFMMTMCKFSGFAYAVQDAYSYSQSEENLTESQKKYMISNFSTTEYFSYIFFVSSSMCGPFIEFRDFMNFIHLKEEYKKIPSTILPSILRLMTGFIFYGLYHGLKDYANPENIIDEKNKFSFVEKTFFYILSCVYEYKYIGGFCLFEAGLIASGISYNGTESEAAPTHGQKKEYDEWGKIRGVNIIKLQTVHRVNDFFHYWNISVHIYLKRYVYSRVIPANATQGQKQFASSVTFFVSALWHGFHPAYFVTFLHFYLCILAEKQFMKVFKGDSMENNKLVDFLFRCIILLVLVPYHCLMFICLDYVKLFKLFKAFYAFGTIFVVVSYILLLIYSSFFVKKAKEKEVRNEKEKENKIK